MKKILFHKSRALVSLSNVGVVMTKASEIIIFHVFHSKKLEINFILIENLEGNYFHKC